MAKKQEKRAEKEESVLKASQEQVEETKYYAGPVIQKFKEERGFEFPAGYGDNKIVLLVRDPYWVHAYWELSPQRSEELILRVYDVTDIIFDGTNAWSFFDITVTGGARNWYINVRTPNRSYVADLGHLTGEGKFITFARSNTVTTPRSGPSEIIDEEWMTVEFKRMYALSGGYGIGKGSEEIKELMARRIKEEAMPPWVSSGWMVSPVGKKVEARKFWLQVGTELIVYGATEPDAKVSLQGQPVKLREDGTFSARFALPDGKQEVEVEACSSDGKEKKVIIPIVEKKTKSH